MPNAIPAPLPLTKSETPRNLLAKGGMTILFGAFGRAVKTIKTPIAAHEFWSCAQSYCTRNLAELSGIIAGAGTPGNVATVKTTTTKRPQRKTLSAGA